MIAIAILAATLSTTPGVTRADCANNAKLQANWIVAVKALGDHDQATAKARTEVVIEACGQTSPTWGPRTLRADLALGDGDNERALALLAPVPDPLPGALGSIPGWIRLRAYENQKNAAGFAAERTTLLNAVDHALGEPAGRWKGRRLERFDVGPDHVAAYQAIVAQGAFERHLEFVISTDAPFEEPQSIMITNDLGAAAIAKQMGVKADAPIFVDRYNCDGHVTLPPVKTYDYGEAKAAVVAALQANPAFGGGVTPVKSCHWSRFVTPGLGD